MQELHIVTTGEQSLAEMLAVAKAVHPYVSFFHLREKSRSRETLRFWLASLIQAGVPRGKLIVNGDARLAEQMQIGGVHLPERGPFSKSLKALYPRLRIGVSVHSLNSALRKEKEGADYLIFGHVFPTSCKPGLAGRGIETLRAVAEAAACPVIAIGGITPGNTLQIEETGASGIAVRSGVMNAADPLTAVRQYAKRIL